MLAASARACFEAVDRAVAEKVDRAELVESPHAPYRQALTVRDVMCTLERLLGSGEVVRPRASPDDLEGFARDLREAGTLRRRERLPRGCLRFVAPIFADRGVSGERVDRARRVCSSPVLLRFFARRGDAGPRVGPCVRRHCGTRQPQMRSADTRGRRGAGTQLNEESRPHFDCSVVLSGEGECVEEVLGGVDIRRSRPVSSGSERARAWLPRSPGRRLRWRAVRLRRARPRHDRGVLRPVRARLRARTTAREAGAGVADHVERACRDRGTLGREQEGEHRIPGQCVAETEGTAIGLARQQLRVDAATERGEDDAFVEARHRREQVPVEAASEHGGGGQDGTGVGPDHVESSPDQSTKVIGSTGSTDGSSDQPPSCCTSAPDATVAASSSSTRKGTPSARSARLRSSSGISPASRHEATRSVTAARSRRSNWTRVEIRRASRARARQGRERRPRAERSRGTARAPRRGCRRDTRPLSASPRQPSADPRARAGSPARRPGRAGTARQPRRGRSPSRRPGRDAPPAIREQACERRSKGASSGLAGTPVARTAAHRASTSGR